MSLQDTVFARATLADLHAFVVETEAFDPMALGRLAEITYQRRKGAAAAQVAGSERRRALALAVGAPPQGVDCVWEAQGEMTRAALDRNAVLDQLAARCRSTSDPEVAILATAVVGLIRTFLDDPPEEGCNHKAALDIAERVLGTSSAGKGPAAGGDTNGGLTSPAVSAPPPVHGGQVYEHIAPDLLFEEGVPC